MRVVESSVIHRFLLASSIVAHTTRCFKINHKRTRTHARTTTRTILGYTLLYVAARLVLAGVPDALPEALSFSFFFPSPLFPSPSLASPPTRFDDRHVTGFLAYALHGGTLTTHATATLHAKARIVLSKSPPTSHPRAYATTAPIASVAFAARSDARWP